MTDQAHNVTAAHITKHAQISGGKPCIAGTRIRVQDVYLWHEMGGKSAAEIATAHELSLAQVYAALTYAFDHLDTIQADIHASDAYIDALKSQYPSKLPKRNDG